MERVAFACRVDYGINIVIINVNNVIIIVQQLSTTIGTLFLSRVS